MTDPPRWRLRHEHVSADESVPTVVAWCTAPDGSPRVAFRAHPYDEQISVWDTEAGRREADLIARDNQLWFQGASACFTVDDREIMAIAENSILGLWDRTTGQPLTILGEQPAGIEDMAIVPGPRLVTCGSDSQVRIWDLTPGPPIVLSGHRDDYVETVVVFTDGDATRLATGSSDGLVIIWDLATGTEVRRFDLGDWVLSLAVLPHGNRMWLLAACSNIGMHRLDPDIGELPWPAERSNEVDHVVVGTGPQGRPRVVGAAYGGEILIWDPDQLELELTIPAQDILTYPVTYRHGLLTLRGRYGWQCLELLDGERQ